mgnify:CR=1 FL=1
MAKNTATAELETTLPAREGKPSPPKTDIRREYAVSGPRRWLEGPAILAQYEDEILAELGRDAYAQAANDPVIESSVEDLVVSATQEDPILIPVFPLGHDRHDEAMEAVAFCQRVWEGIENDAHDSLEQLARGATYYGHQVAEQTFQNGTGEDAGRWTVKYWKALPRESTSFVVDRYMNVLGLLANQKGVMASIGGSLWNDSEVVAREKFTVLTLRGNGADPRGRSLIRSAMTARGIKRQVLIDYVKFLGRHATVVPIGIAGEDASYEQPVDREGNPIEGAEPLTPAQAMANKLALLSNHEAIGLPHGAEVTTLDLQGDSDLFLNALQWLDSQMTRGILMQVLTTTEAQHGTRAQASVHENVKDLLVSWLRLTIGRTLRRDLFRLVMKVNFGQETAKELTPIVTLGDFDRKSWAEDGQTWCSMVETGDLDEFQLNTGWSALGLQRGPEGTVKPYATKTPVTDPAPGPAPKAKSAGGVSG